MEQLPSANDIRVPHVSTVTLPGSPSPWQHIWERKRGKVGRRGSEHRSYTLFSESRGVAERVGDVVAIVVTAFLVGAVVDDVT